MIVTNIYTHNTNKGAVKMNKYLILEDGTTYPGTAFGDRAESL